MLSRIKNGKMNLFRKLEKQLDSKPRTRMSLNYRSNI